MKLRNLKNFRWLAIIIIALIGLGLFIYFFWSPTKLWWGIPEEIKEAKSSWGTIEKSISSVYRYDLKEKQYLPDQGESWQNQDFVRYIYDLAPEGEELDRCYYFFYDNLKQEVTWAGERRCNAQLTIAVGEGKACPSQAENSCTLYLYAVDKATIQGEMKAITYHIDWQAPEVGKAIEKEKNLFQAEVSDNLALNYCWLYLNQENVGAMEIEEGLATLNYPNEEEVYTFWVTCADYYEPERENYLNISSGETGYSVLAQNHAPKISSCKVTPIQGTRATEFLFEVEASDQDEDALSYTWEFGDGESSSEESPSHSYLNPSTFEPKVIVSDGIEIVECATAWVIVLE